MPKAKPVSLHPLNIEEALKALIEIDPATVRISTKPRKRKRKKKLKRH